MKIVKQKQYSNCLLIDKEFFYFKVTWTSPDGQTRNQIDYMLIQNRWKTSLKNVKKKKKMNNAADRKKQTTEKSTKTIN